MSKEEFLEKIKALKIDVPDEEFWLEYNASVCNLLDENKRLKEQYCERTDCAGRIGNSKRVELLESVIEEVRETLINSKEYKMANAMSLNAKQSVLIELLQILDKAKGGD